MSRSRRSTPIHGCCGGSESEDKKIWHRRYRRRESVAIRRRLDVMPHRWEVSNPWLMVKDGKFWFEDELEGFRHLLRK